MERFTWNNLDSGFIKEILRASDHTDDFEDMIQAAQDDKDILISMMNTICDYPDKKFIMNFRAIIEQNLLKNYPEEIKKICKILKIDGSNYNMKQAKLTKKALSSSLIGAYIGAILEIAGMDVEYNEFSKFRYTVSLNMAETQTEEIPLYDFQQDAVNKMREHFLKKDAASGLLIMPTGSGKSRTATYFLIREMISRGYQILWIAHRYMLLDQAADCFYNFAGLAKIENPVIKNYRISCISGEHLSIKSANKDEIVIASINSICRSKEHLRRILGKKVMIVVDEAHHTFAPTYQEVIRYIRKTKPDTKLLGLTATPVRGNEKDSKSLLQLYDNHIVYDIPMGELITKGILADPKFIRIETEEDFEPIISIDEEKMIKRYGELPESLVNKIASSNTRNAIIIKEYLDHKADYGKTLIFAMNVLHCRFLYEELSKHHIKCGHIYSGKEGNATIINDFKENRIDVLINVNIMTEGTDVPDIQTIFLTRPTQSEGLLMQMIGRGMRGIQAKGTESVNIVDFHDKWHIFNKWLNPEWVISDEKEEPKPKSNSERNSDYVSYEWKMCQEIYQALVFQAAEYGRNVSLPLAWYSLIDEEGEIYRMLLFEDQIDGILKMMKDKSLWKDNLEITAKDILDQYFAGFVHAPSERDIELLMDNVRTLEIPPQRNALAHRRKIDPYYVVKRAEEEARDVFELIDEVYQQYDITKDIYGSKEHYAMQVCRAKVYQRRSNIIGLKVEELPVELIPFDRAPYYDLQRLVQVVKDEMFDGTYAGISSIEWTDKSYKTYYGVYYGDDSSIRINSILNSKDVPEEVVKFVIYHELLHRDNMSHDTGFRFEEHKYPNWENCEHFLYGNMGLFDIEEW